MFEQSFDTEFDHNIENLSDIETKYQFLCFN